MYHNQFRKQIILLILLVLPILSLVACNSPETTEAQEPVTAISLQLSWVHTVEYSAFYLAEEHGHFANENLSADLRTGGFDTEGNYINAIDNVLSGEADFGMADGNSVLLARADGLPLVAIATLYQRNPAAFMSLADKNIIQPKDWVGKTVAIDLQSGTGISYLALLASQGIDPSEINHVPRTGFDNAQLINGEVDVLDAFITNQPVQLEQAGYDINIVLAADYGIEASPTVTFTTERLIAENPDVVERFLRATILGLKDAIADPAGATNLALARNDTLNYETEFASMNRSLALLQPINSQPGMMTASAWEIAHQILLDQNLLTDLLDLEAAYNLTFLQKIYQ
jgi:NitT/TauT family transport system substrate-binding protein